MLCSSYSTRRHLNCRRHTKQTDLLTLQPFRPFESMWVLFLYKGCRALCANLYFVIRLFWVEVRRQWKSPLLTPKRASLMLASTTLSWRKRLGEWRDTLDQSTTLSFIPMERGKWTMPVFTLLHTTITLHTSHITHSYSSGGEDGYVRVHTFDPSYFEFDFEYWMVWCTSVAIHYIMSSIHNVGIALIPYQCMYYRCTWEVGCNMTAVYKHDHVICSAFMNLWHIQTIMK